mmetsp:Transcript_34929/g.80021  ORF Transcript_34929/g.80021 Transcript_34929/m.80021 type:complete len:246 (+) Transcript_34929:4355-5092(+)
MGFHVHPAPQRFALPVRLVCLRRRLPGDPLPWTQLPCAFLLPSKNRAPRLPSGFRVLPLLLLPLPDRHPQQRAPFLPLPSSAPEVPAVPLWPLLHQPSVAALVPGLPWLLKVLSQDPEDLLPSAVFLPRSLDAHSLHLLTSFGWPPVELLLQPRLLLSAAGLSPIQPVPQPSPFAFSLHPLTFAGQLPGRPAALSSQLLPLPSAALPAPMQPLWLPLPLPSAAAPVPVLPVPQSSPFALSLHPLT